MKAKNRIILSHPTRDLITIKSIPTKQIYLLFWTIREFDEWHHALLLASKLSKETVFTEEIFIYLTIHKSKELENLQIWTSLSSTLKQREVCTHGDWVVALISRIFSQYYHTESFLNFVKYKLQNRLSKIEKPKLLVFQILNV
jgi:hypothetical protein